MIKLLQKDNPTAFSPMGGLVPTQEKKKKNFGSGISVERNEKLKLQPRTQSPH